MTKKQFIKNITSMYNEPYDQALHILNDEHAYNGVGDYIGGDAFLEMGIHDVKQGLEE